MTTVECHWEFRFAKFDLAQRRTPVVLLETMIVLPQVECHHRELAVVLSMLILAHHSVGKRFGSGVLRTQSRKSALAPA
jgi:hypothetical protein